jgi:hypothetical protein
MFKNIFMDENPIFIVISDALFPPILVIDACGIETR